MNNVVKPAHWWNDRQPPQLPPDPPEPPHMDQRVAKLEALAERTDGRLHAIDKDLAVLRAEVKTSIAEAKNSIIVWVVAAVFLAQLLPVVAALVKHYFP